MTNAITNGSAAPVGPFGIVMPLADHRGGAESMLLRMLEANRQGERIDYRVVFLDDGPMVKMVRQMGYAATIIHAGRMRQPHRGVLAVLKLWRWIRANKIAVVLSWMEKAHLYAGPAAWLAGVPAAWYLHSIQRGRGISAWNNRIPAKAVMCCSDYVRQSQNDFSSKTPSITLKIAVDLSKFDPAMLPTVNGARQLLELPTNVPLIGMVARLQRWKGVHHFVEAAAEVAKLHPTAQFVVVGGEWWDEPSYPTELQSLADKLGLGERMRFVGQQSNVVLWMQAMDIFVHASDNEPAGLVIIEAMSLGKPVVAARSPGPMELAAEGVEAIFCNYADVAALSHALHRLLSDKAESARLGINGRARSKQFSAVGLSEKLGCVLKTLEADRP